MAESHTKLVAWDYPLRSLFFTLVWRETDDVLNKCSTCAKWRASMECASCMMRACSTCFPGKVPSRQDLAAEIGEDPKEVGYHRPLSLLVLCDTCLPLHHTSVHGTTAAQLSFRVLHPVNEQFVPFVRIGPKLHEDRLVLPEHHGRLVADADPPAHVPQVAD